MMKPGVVPSKMTAEVQGRKIDNCTDCPHHAVEADPDPDDWFCDDDVKVRCTKSMARYNGNMQQEPFITVGCRPYRTQQECDIPAWCPLMKKEKTPVAELA